MFILFSVTLLLVLLLSWYCPSCARRGRIDEQGMILESGFQRHSSSQYSDKYRRFRSKRRRSSNNVDSELQRYSSPHYLESNASWQRNYQLQYLYKSNQNRAKSIPMASPTEEFELDPGSKPMSKPTPIAQAESNQANNVHQFNDSSKRYVRGNKKILPDTFTSMNRSAEHKNFAVCLTGQLVRLELGSKITNFIIPNLELGHRISLFILLDSLVNEVKGAKRVNRFDAKQALYANFTSDQLHLWIHRHIPSHLMVNFKLYVRVEPPLSSSFPSRDASVPVCSVKSYGDKDKDERSAWHRFHSHLMWQAGLRQCVMWAQQYEVKSREFFDFFIRRVLLLTYFSSFLNSKINLHYVILSTLLSLYVG